MTTGPLNVMRSPDKIPPSPTPYQTSPRLYDYGRKFAIAFNARCNSAKKPIGDLIMYYFQTSFDLEESTKLAMSEEDMPEAPEVWTLEDFQEFVPYYSEDEK
jgi:hypothetical protein